MAERLFYSSVWNVDDLMYASVTGMILTEVSVRLKVGELPKVDFTMNVNAFLQKLSEEELDKITGLIKKLQLSKLRIGVDIE